MESWTLNSSDGLPMQILKAQPAFSYRDDAEVPDFDDSTPIAFMDGHCVLCSWSARMISRMDRKGEFRICPCQTDLGRAVLAHYGLSAHDPDSWLYLVDGRAYGSMDGVIRIGARLGGLGKALLILRVLPRFVQDWIYRVIARNRYRLGRADMCSQPSEALRRRLMGQ